MLPEPLTRHLTDEELLLDFYGEGWAGALGCAGWASAGGAGRFRA